MISREEKLKEIERLFNFSVEMDDFDDLSFHDIGWLLDELKKAWKVEADLSLGRKIWHDVAVDVGKQLQESLDREKVMREALKFYKNPVDIDLAGEPESEFDGREWLPLGSIADKALAKCEEMK